MVGVGGWEAEGGLNLPLGQDTDSGTVSSVRDRHRHNPDNRQGGRQQ